MATDKGVCEIYKDGSGKWRWRATAANGNIVGASSQGYVNKSDCVANAKLFGYGSCQG
jgi:uncharacterized protein YegP (UPF0339 family)